MKRFGAVLALYVVAVTLPARAASPRTFVSFAGVDSNPCSRPAPCRSFSAALAQTMAGGVIVVLDSAGYGPVTIGQSVSLIAPDGVYAGITATSGNGVTLYGTTSSDIVILRGLSIEGTGTANFGVQLLASTDIKQLHVQRCAFRGFVFAGIQFYASGVLIVSDTFMNPSGTGIDVFAAPNAFQPRAFIDHCRVVGGGNAYHIDGATVTITNSVAAENLNSGISVQTSPANVTVAPARTSACSPVADGPLD